MGAVSFHDRTVVRVLVPLAMPTLLDYLAEGPVQPGSWVQLELGRKPVDGVVVELPGRSDFKNLKTARLLADVAAVDPRMLAFYRWVARYTLSAPGEPLRVAMPRARVPEPPKRILKTAEEKAGLPPASAVVLNEAQQRAAAAIGGALGDFKAFLLDGVTGSGKTEVYFDAVRTVLASGGQVLVLVPEIALTPQWLKRFEQRFGVAPLVWHSGLADGARRRTWWALQNSRPPDGTPGTGSGETGKRPGQVLVGARSALFLPFGNLGLVVVDEEHEPSYKQEEAFRYHARDLAVQLASTWRCPVVLASATPSLESWQRALEGKYIRLVLPDRHGHAGMAPIRLIDLREGGKNKNQEFISPALRVAVAETLAKGEQALLFLNRRGNAPVLICTDCGTRRDCPRCDATLVVHGDKLQCHHCGFSEPYPHECPVCGGQSLRAYGPGTRRVVAEVQKVFPDARVAVADSDAVSTPQQLSALVKQVEDRAVDIIVGTQMVTKGHHFPHLTCVGVIDADMGLAHGDLRAAERTFQLLTQVAGRAGRGDYPGTVYVQTFDPAQPLFQALVKHDRDGFYKLELEARKAWGDPPFGRLVAVIIDGLDEASVVEGARTLARAFVARDGARLLGPAPAPIAKIRDRYRYRLLVKGPGLLQGLVKKWIEETAVPKGVRVTVDVDPVSFF